MGGYKDWETSPGHHHIEVRGNGFTDLTTLREYFHRRATEVCGGAYQGTPHDEVDKQTTAAECHQQLVGDKVLTSCEDEQTRIRHTLVGEVTCTAVEPHRPVISSGAPDWFEIGESTKHDIWKIAVPPGNSDGWLLVSIEDASTHQITVSKFAARCGSWEFKFYDNPEWEVAGPGSMVERALHAVCDPANKGPPSTRSTASNSSEAKQWDATATDANGQHYAVIAESRNRNVVAVSMTYEATGTGKVETEKELYDCSDRTVKTVGSEKWVVVPPSSVIAALVEKVCQKYVDGSQNL